MVLGSARASIDEMDGIEGGGRGQDVIRECLDLDLVVGWLAVRRTKEWARVLLRMAIISARNSDLCYRVTRRLRKILRCHRQILIFPFLNLTSLPDCC